MVPGLGVVLVLPESVFGFPPVLSFVPPPGLLGFAVDSEKGEKREN